MKLTKYREKRQFSKTPEPKGKITHSKKNPIFVIQKHAARHLHYDLRLEIDGVLKSWAVPKGPCLDPSIKRLAVQVEDHPLEYGNFEGLIPEGEYGGGIVMLWDKGTWHGVAEHESPKKNKKDTVIYFELKGKKLKGIWKLVKIQNDPKNWLLIKHKDKEAISQDAYNILEEQSLSVKSKKTIDEIAKNIRKAKSNLKSLPKNTIKNTIKNILESENFKKAKLKKSKLPAQIKPQLAMLTDEVPKGDDWLHEMKLDGYRLITYIQNNEITILTRNGLDWTSRFKNIASELKKLKLNNTILDGECVVLDESGKPNFQFLQNALNKSNHEPMIYYIFDMLYYQGYNLSNQPLINRKQWLEQIIPKNHSTLRYSEHIIGQGDTLFKKACQLGLEGIVSKKCEANYIQKRTPAWLKVKCHHRQEFLVGGYTQSNNPLAHFGALLLGYYEGKAFKYCGRVGTGFNNQSFKEVFNHLQKLKTKTSPFSSPIPMQNFEAWVKPKLIVEVEFSEFTSEGFLRQASFNGIRKDKQPSSISKEKTYPSHNKFSNFNFQITHPDRIVYPKIEVTKLEIAQYYYIIEDWILPFIKNRAFAIVRCPDSISESCFFQKHVPYNKATQHIFQGDKYIYIKDIQGLLELVQMGTIEIHNYGTRVDNLNKPDHITFDLDPGEGVSWKKVVDTAFLIKEELEKQNLTSFVKTTGGKGLHIVVPIIRRYDWEYVSLFSKTFSEYIASKYPKEYTSDMSKAKRKHKIYIDYLRNKPGASSIAPYSLRTRELATVSTPLSWEELSIQLKPTDFTIETLPTRLEKLSVDPWELFFNLKQRLPK